MEKLKIIFMGTPDFSVPVLQALAENHKVLAVYTQPPKPVGRGGKLTKSPVQAKAEELGIAVLTPKSLKKEEAQEQMRSFGADVGIVAAYGLILPQAVLDMFPKGCINIHASLLPRWRGAAPIQRALIAGDVQTGITIMQMDAGLDTGDMLLKEETAITENTTGQELHDVLSRMGARLILRTLAENPTPVKQPDEGNTYAKKIEREEYFFDFSEPADLLERKIRALGSLSFMRGDDRISVLKARAMSWEAFETGAGMSRKENQNRLDVAENGGNYFPRPDEVMPENSGRVAEAENEDMLSDETVLGKKEEGKELRNSLKEDGFVPGTVLDENMALLCGKNTVLIPLIIKRSGKRAMPVSDFLRGCRILKGERF